MAWTTPATWVNGVIVQDSDLNAQIRDNMNYLLNGRIQSVINRNNGSTYTTTSASFVPVDSTNLSIQVTLNGTRVLIGFAGSIVNNTGTPAFDVTIDGTRYASLNTEGIFTSNGSGASSAQIGFVVLKTGLTALTPHTFQLVWKTPAGTAQLYSTTALSPVTFWVLEV